MRIPEGKHVTAFDTYTLYSDVRYFESDKKHALTFLTYQKQRNRSIIHNICWVSIKKKIHVRVPILFYYYLCYCLSQGISKNSLYEWKMKKIIQIDLVQKNCVFSNGYGILVFIDEKKEDL